MTANIAAQTGPPAVADLSWLLWVIIIGGALAWILAIYVRRRGKDPVNEFIKGPESRPKPGPGLGGSGGGGGERDRDHVE